MPVTRRSMPSAHRRHRRRIPRLPACLPVLALIVLSGWGLASADEGTAPPQATPTPAAAPALKPDSIVTAVAAPRDSSAKASESVQAPAQEPQPAERLESPPAEKPVDAVKPAEAAPNLATPKVSSTKGAARALTRTRPSRAPARPKTARARRHAPRPAAVHDTFTEADRVQTELERTERFVGRAQKSILTSKNTRAIKLFTSALDFQSDSREACKVHQYARAERLTLAARDFADRATRMVGPPREDPDYVEHVLRRTDDALDRAKDVLKTGAGRYAWNQHEGLRQEQKDAWKIFKQGDVGSAYKQTLGVREGVLVLLRQLQDLPVPRETAEKAIGGAQAALEQASRELGPRPSVEAQRLVRLAGEYLTKARQSFQRGSYRSALLQAKVVERHVEHAVDVGRPGSG
jgi:hypothetical protein